MKTKRRLAPVQTTIPAHSGMGNTTPAPIHTPTPHDPSLVAHIAELESVINLQTRMLEAQTAVVNAHADVLAHEMILAHQESMANSLELWLEVKTQRHEIGKAKGAYADALRTLHVLTVEAATRQIDVIRAQVRMLQSAAGILIDSVTRDV